MPIPLYTRDSRYQLRVAAAVSAGDYARTEMLADEQVDVVVVDSAHGHTKGILDMVSWICKHFPDIDVIGGTWPQPKGPWLSATLARTRSGRHRSRSICTTRVVCGVGIPQITAVFKAAEALENSIPVIADGGIRLSGDVPKALVAGADTVMLGSILAGTDESPGEKIIHEGRHYVVYRGMGSLAAMKDGKGSASVMGRSTSRMTSWCRRVLKESCRWRDRSRKS
jgi:IMP dehydrogenase